MKKGFLIILAFLFGVTLAHAENESTRSILAEPTADNYMAGKMTKFNDIDFGNDGNNIVVVYFNDGKTQWNFEKVRIHPDVKEEASEWIRFISKKEGVEIRIKGSRLDRLESLEDVSAPSKLEMVGTLLPIYKDPLVSTEGIEDVSEGLIKRFNITLLSEDEITEKTKRGEKFKYLKIKLSISRDNRYVYVTSRFNRVKNRRETADARNSNIKFFRINGNWFAEAWASDYVSKRKMAEKLANSRKTKFTVGLRFELIGDVEEYDETGGSDDVLVYTGRRPGDEWMLFNQFIDATYNYGYYGGGGYGWRRIQKGKSTAYLFIESGVRFPLIAGSDIMIRFGFGRPMQGTGEWKNIYALDAIYIYRIKSFSLTGGLGIATRYSVYRTNQVEIVVGFGCWGIFTEVRIPTIKPELFKMCLGGRLFF